MPKVKAAVSTESPWCGGVFVPRHVRLDSVQPHKPGLVDPVRPLVRVDPEVVDGAGENTEGLPVQQEVVVANGDGVQGDSSGVVSRPPRTAWNAYAALLQTTNSRGAGARATPRTGWRSAAEAIMPSSTSMARLRYHRWTQR